MHIFPNYRQTAQRASVITIGNFDGLHLGHQQLISAVQAQAQHLSALSTVMLFEPQPMEFFCPTCAPARLMPLNNKLRTLRHLGIEQTAVIKFTEQIAQWSAQTFVEELLVRRLNAQAVWVGDDFRFGIGRSGDFALMQSLGQRYGFEVAQAPSLMHDGKRVSSTWIRETLAVGDMPLAETLLGSPYRIYGRVMHGQQLGRQIGFPTMNINLSHPLAVSGVFAVMITGLSDQPKFGVANLGVRPSVNRSVNRNVNSNALQQRLEVHVFDWQESVYGQKIEVSFHHRLRSEQRFDSLEQLTQQIQQDAIQAKQWWQMSAQSVI